MLNTLEGYITFTSYGRKPTLAQISQVIGEHYNSDLSVRKRTASISWPRHVAMAVSYMFGYSYPAIGLFYGYDHTTVICAKKGVTLQNERYKAKKHMGIKKISPEISKLLFTLQENGRSMYL